MSAQSKTALETAIDTIITTNGNNDITGAQLNAILNNMVDSYEDFVGSYTTVQIAALTGMTLRQRVFDTDFNEYKYYDGTRWVFESHPKYEVYTALLTQTGTNAPVPIVLENTLGGTPVWSYSDVGNYVGALSGIFTNNKTWLSITNMQSADSGTNMVINRIDSDTVAVGTSLTNLGGATFDNANDRLTNTPIEIRVYY